MRNKDGTKPGALSPEQCFERAAALISEHGICLFIVDLVHSRKLDSAEGKEQYALLGDFQRRANELFGDHMPEHSLVALGRIERGFAGVLGDSALVGIDDPELIWSIIELKDRDFPALRLHYGVAADGWSPGIELIK